jgi:PAS domain S-box-containing protein
MNDVSTAASARISSQKVAGTYCAAALLWILLSDKVMLALVGSDISSLESFSIFKGFFFVFITSAILYFALQRMFLKLGTTIQDTRASQLLLEAIGECMPAGVYAKDISGKYIVCNSTAAAIIGVPARQVIGSKSSALFPVELAERIDAEDRQIVRRLTSIVSEQSYLVHDRALIGRTTRGPIKAPDGQLLGTYGIIQDITELRNAVTELAESKAHLEDLIGLRTAALRAAEQQFKLIIDSAAEGLIFVDEEGIIRLVNPSGLALLGYTAAELYGRSIHEAIHHTIDDSIPSEPDACSLLTGVRSGSKCTLTDHYFWHRDGHSIPVAAALNPIFSDGQVSGSVISFFDISEQKQAETARESARAAAEQIAQLKGEFLANMSHEIRTPLNGILGLAHIGFRDSVGRGKAEQTFSRILDTGKLLLAIINDILDFSKIEAGQFRVESVPVDINSVLERSIQTVRELADAKGLAISHYQAAGVPAAILGDSLRISQILLNLLSNAIKFTQSGQIRLLVSRDMDWMEFRVIDTGMGISSESLQRLFKPFEQADTSVTRKFGGTGLGLTISKRLAELMGGDLLIQSTVGIGTTALLRLPCVVVECAPESEAIHTPPGGRRLNNLRVLAAEDNPINSLVLEELLTQEGCIVTMVDTGLAAVEAVRTLPSGFDAILMDVQMPDMDGVEATRKIREFAQRIPIIGQTAHAMHEEHDRCLAAGMSSVLTKPLDPEVLVSHMLQQVHRHVQERPFDSPDSDATKKESTEIINWRNLSAQYAGRTPVLNRLVDLALKNTEGLSPRLRSLAKSEGIDEIASAAYECRLIAANLFAPQLEVAAIQLIARSGSQPAAVAALAQSLADRVDEFHSELRRHVSVDGA